jgi:hypothetical protein
MTPDGCGDVPCSPEPVTLPPAVDPAQLPPFRSDPSPLDVPGWLAALADQVSVTTGVLLGMAVLGALALACCLLRRRIEVLYGTWQRR